MARALLAFLLFAAALSTVPVASSLPRPEALTPGSPCRPGSVLGGPARSQRVGPLDRALLWLAARQRPGGSFDGDMETTAIAVLAFLAVGETHSHGSCRNTVAEALRWMAGRQQSDGGFGPGGAAAAFAMVEAAGLSGSGIARRIVRRATEFLARTFDAPATPTERAFGCAALAGGHGLGLVGEEVVLKLADFAFVPIEPGGAPVLGAVRLLLRSSPPLLDSDRNTAAAREETRREADLLVGGTGSAEILLWTTMSVFEVTRSTVVSGDLWRRQIEALAPRLGLPGPPEDPPPFAGLFDAPGTWRDERSRIRTTALLARCLAFYYRYPR
jgi:hypothetical protein